MNYFIVRDQCEFFSLEGGAGNSRLCKSFGHWFMVAYACHRKKPSNDHTFVDLFILFLIFFHFFFISMTNYFHLCFF